MKPDAEVIRAFLEDQSSKVQSMKHWTKMAIVDDRLPPEHWTDGPYPPMEQLITLCRVLLLTLEASHRCHKLLYEDLSRSDAINDIAYREVEKSLSCCRQIIEKGEK